MFSSRYSPCKVNNPRDGHMVILLPNQRLIINLDEASKWQKDAPVRALFDVTTSSPFLIKHAEAHSEDGNTEIIYEQLYDTTSWCEHGAIYLGEVKITVNNTVTILCLYGRSSSTNKIVTVVNPKDYNVKIEPDQILEIVVHGRSEDVIQQNSDFVKSDLIINGKKSQLWDNGSQLLEKLREETVICPNNSPHRESVFNIINRDIGSLPINPTLMGATKIEGEKRIKVNAIEPTATVVQRHYWLRLNPVECESIAVDKTHCFITNPELAGVSVTVGSERGTFFVYKVNLSLCQRGLIKKGWPAIENPDVIKETGKQQGLTDQYYSSSQGLIANPPHSLSHELSPTDVGVIIELASPSAMHPNVVEYPNIKWEVFSAPIQTAGSVGDKGSRLTVVSLPCRYINCNKIQRFLVVRNKMVTDSPCVDNAFFLGIIHIKCESLSVLGDKVINLWEVKTKNQKKDTVSGLQLKPQVRKPINKTKTTKTTALAIVPPVRPFTQQDAEAETARWRGVNWQTPVIPPLKRFVKVTVKEQFEELSIGAEVTVFETVVNKVFEDDTKRHRGNHRHSGHEHACAYTPAYQGKKKEENTSQKNEVRKTPPNQTSPARKENKVFMIDPKDEDYQVLTYKQELIIQCPVEYWGLKQDLEHLWLATTLSPGQPKVRIKSQRMVASTDGNYVQEFVVRFVPSYLREFKDKLGKHFSGGIRFENATSYFTIGIYLDVLAPIDEDEINAMQEQRAMFRDLLLVNKSAKLEMEREARAKEQAILAKAKAQETILANAKGGGMTHCIREDTIGCGTTLVNVNDRIKVILNTSHKDAQWDIGYIPDWLDFTNRRQTEYNDIFEFETNPKAFVAQMESLADLKFVHVKGDVKTQKVLSMRLVSPHIKPVKPVMPVDVLG